MVVLFIIENAKDSLKSKSVFTEIVRIVAVLSGCWPFVQVRRAARPFAKYRGNIAAPELEHTLIQRIIEAAQP